MSGELRAPLPLRPIPVARPWGGRQIAAYLAQPLPSGRIGELIQAADESVVAGGAFAGATLGELLHRFGPALLGEGYTLPAARGPAFPLLARFLDAPHWGPLHAHLGELASPQAGAEIWHVLAAHEGSGAVLGFAGQAAACRDREADVRETDVSPRPGVAERPSPPAPADRLLDRPLAEVAMRRALHAGETILLPPGIVRALGGGALVFALRVSGARTICLELAPAEDIEGEPVMPADLAGLAFDAVAGDGRATAPAPTLPGARGLARWAGLGLERAGLLAPAVERFDGVAAALYTPLAGELRLSGAAGTVLLRRGESALVPATAGAVELRPAGGIGVCTLLKTTLESP